MQNLNAQGTTEATEHVSFLQGVKNFFARIGSIFTRKNPSQTENEVLMDKFKDENEVPKKSKVPTKNLVALIFGIFAIAAAVIASVFFGPALYTAITGLLPAVVSGLAAITTGLAATVPLVALVIIAVATLALFTVGVCFAIHNARSIKAQKGLSENEQPLLKDQEKPKDQDQPNQDDMPKTKGKNENSNDNQIDHKEEEEDI